MTDIELVPLAFGGDEDAFLRLYKTYYRLARHVAGQCTHSYADAEDAAQLVFVWLLEGRWRLDPATVTDGGNLFGLVRTLAVYASWRSYRPREEQNDDEVAVAVRIARSTWPTPEGRLLRLELRQRIRDAIRALPAAYRRVAIARYSPRTLRA